MDLALIARTARGVPQTHVMRERVHCASLKRGEGGRENQGFTVGILLEQKQLRVELQRLAVVEVDLWERWSDPLECSTPACD